MPIEVITPSTGSVLTLDEVKVWLKADGTTNEDALIPMLLSAATSYTESTIRQYLLRQTVKYTIPSWEQRIKLPARPLAGVTQIQYYDGDNVLQTYDASNYEIVKGKYPYVRTYNTWPSLYDDREYPIEITISVGYDDAAAVPADIKTFILAAVAFMYTNRSTHSANVNQDLREVFNLFVGKYKNLVL